MGLFNKTTAALSRATLSILLIAHFKRGDLIHLSFLLSSDLVSISQSRKQRLDHWAKGEPAYHLGIQVLNCHIDCATVTLTRLHMTL